MRILALTQGSYGERIVENIRTCCPGAWEVTAVAVPPIREVMVDEPERYLPQGLGPADLVLHLGESPQAAELLVAVVARTGARGVVAPTDHSHWIPKGLRLQLERELGARGVAIVFPEPFCSLTETTYGYKHGLKPYRCEAIAGFARSFGRPILEVALADGAIAGAEVRRGAPCGSTQYTVGRIRGMEAAKAVPASGLMCLHYPCLASMRFERMGDEIDTVMHNAGRIFNEAMAEALGVAS